MRHVSDIFKPARGYNAKLESGQWTRFSKDIRLIKGNACENCKRTNMETNIHHLFYNPNTNPWEYRSIDVVLLCRSCHDQVHEGLKDFRRFVFRSLNGSSFRVLNGALKVGLEENDPLEFCYAIAEMAASPGSVKRFCEAWIAKGPISRNLTVERHGILA